MADLVNEIIAQEAFKQLDDVIVKLGEATKAVNDLAAAGKTITIEFKGINNLQALNDLLNLSAGKITAMNQAAQGLAAANIALNTATQQLNLSTKENADRLAQQRLELGYVQEQLKLVTKDIVEGKGNIDANNKSLADWTRRQQELKIEIGATTSAIKTQIKESNAARGSMDQMSQTLFQLKERYRALDDQQRNATGGKKMVTDIRTLDAEIKRLDATIGNSQRNVGNYQNAFSSFGATILKGLGIFSGTMLLIQAVQGIKAVVNESIELFRSAEGIRQSFDRLNDPDLLANLREATKGTVSDLELMKQAVKANNLEIPIDKLAIAFKFARERARETGVAMEDVINRVVNGIGRNSVRLLEPLGFSYNRLREETEQLGSFSDAVFSLIEKDVNKVGREILTTADRVDYLNTKIANSKTGWGEFGSLVSEIYKNLAMDLGEFISLQDLSFANTRRASEAYKLQKEQSKQDAALNKESGKIFKGQFRPLLADIDKAADRAEIEALKQKAAERAAIIKKGYEDELAKAQEARKKLEDPKRMIDGIKFATSTRGLHLLEENQKEIDFLKNNIDGVTKAYDKFNEAAGRVKLTRSKVPIDQLNNLSLEQLKALQESVGAEYNPLNATDKAKSKQLTDYYDEVQKRIDEIQGKEAKAKKGPKSETLKSENDLTKALYDEERQRIDQDRDAQREISDNIKAELGDRLVANQQYQSDLVTLATMDRDKTIDIEQQKLKDIDRKRKGASSALLADLDKQEQAAYVRMGAAFEQFETDRGKILIDGRQKDLAIIRSANDEWIKAEEDTFAVRKLDEMTGYLTERNLLQDALDKKEITRKQYDQRIKELQKKEQVSFLEAEIEFDKRILANDQITTEERIRFKTKLLNDEKSLGESRSGQTSQKPKLGNITDPIAKLFSPEGYDQEEAYLKEFYQRTVDLAKAASDAIIESKNREFAAEQKNLDNQATEIRTNAKQKEDVINATAKNEVDRKNQLSKLAAQTAAQENAIEQEKRKVAIAQAKFQRDAAIAGIIQNTALAIAGALKYGAAAPAIIALIAAAGAVQLSAAASAPIPQYRTGTQNHPGGHFIAGDGGERELISAPGKSPYWSNAISTMYNEPAGTKVIPLSKINPLGSYIAGSIARAEAQHAQQINIDALAGKINSGLMDHGERLSHVIWAARPAPQKTESLTDAVKEIKRTAGL